MIAAVPPSESGEIARIFGDEFVRDVMKLPVGIWSGPVRSTYGEHLVLVIEHRPRRIPPLMEVRTAVLRDWANVQTKALAEARMVELLTKYAVAVEENAR